MSTPKKTKKNVAKKAPTAVELAKKLGVALQKPLTTDRIARLRKALPGYAAILDDVAAILKAEESALQLADVSPKALCDLQARQKHLAEREAVAYAVYRSIYEQRLAVDDQAMRMLEKVARRVNALAEDDPSLLARFKVLLDYLSTFRPGPGRKSAPSDGAEPEAA